MKRIGLRLLLCSTVALGALLGCAGNAVSAASTDSSAAVSASANTEAISSAGEGVLDTADLFGDRDLEQEADLANAGEITVKDGEDITISTEGVYVISGAATNVTIDVEADDTAEVQLVLNGVSIANEDAPAIYVASAGKVFITTAEGSENTLSVTGSFATADDANLDGAIFAEDDIVLNGLGALAIESSDNGIVGKGDVKITGGTYNITSAGHGIQGEGLVAVADGTLAIEAETDGIHADGADDQTQGSIYIAGGAFNLDTGNNGIKGDAVVQIDGGTLTIDAAEGIEGTYVQINGGTIDIAASDDGINGSDKSTAYSVTIEITGGNVSIDMADGDTDALDSNGDLIVSGGVIDITAQFAFDFDGNASFTGGTITVNGQQVDEITNSMEMGGGFGGGQPGNQLPDNQSSDNQSGGKSSTQQN